MDMCQCLGMGILSILCYVQVGMGYSQYVIYTSERKKCLQMFRDIA